MPPGTNNRARVRAKFAASAEAHMLAKLKLDVAVFDMGDAWEVMRTDGRELTPAERRAFDLYRAGYRLLNPNA
jgi:hypothetical protein